MSSTLAPAVARVRPRARLPRDWLAGYLCVLPALACLPRQPRLILEVKQKSEIRRGAAWLFARGLAR
jgi:hypothetical protein